MLFAAASWLLLFALQTATATPRDLRFHHLHVRVADPARASKEAASKLAGVRTMLQGHGIAVRAGDEYLVFDREDDSQVAGADSRPHGSPQARAVYQQAIEWAAGHGLTPAPGDFGALTVGDSIPRARIDRIAFSTADPGVAIELLGRKGVKPIERTADAARYRLSNELVLEIIAETNRPDTHWCPMHPDIRSAGVGKCPLCSMDLVPIPPPRIGEYRMNVAVARGRDASHVQLTLRVTDPETDRSIDGFLDVHEKPFHLFVVGRDLEYFAHVHPAQQKDGSFTIEERLAAGVYALIADFLPAGGTPQMVQRTVVTPGYDGPLFAPPPELLTGPHERVVDGLLVRIELERLSPLRPSRLKFVVSDAATGEAVADLEPYLGASGHLLIVDAALRTAIHAHPELPLSSGPVVAFDPVLPAPGRYKLWVQFQRKGQVITAPFVIEVIE